MDGRIEIILHAVNIVIVVAVLLLVGVIILTPA